MTGEQLYNKLYDMSQDGTIGTPTVGWAELAPRERTAWNLIAGWDQITAGNIPAITDAIMAGVLVAVPDMPLKDQVKIRLKVVRTLTHHTADYGAQELWQRLRDHAGVKPGEDEPWEGSDVIEVVNAWLQEHGVNT